MAENAKLHPSSQSKMATANAVEHNHKMDGQGTASLHGREDIGASFQRNLQTVNALDTPGSPSSPNAGGSGATQAGAGLHPLQAKPKKGSFMITRVVTKAGLNDHANEDGDSVDDLDETNTEDVSSDILDVSKTTDIEQDPSSGDTVQSLVGEDLQKESHKSLQMNSTAAQVQNLPSPSQTKELQPTKEISQTASDPDFGPRFQIVRVHNEKYARGRWMCYDFMDSEKSEKPNGDVGSGNSSASSSFHYVPGVDDPNKNPFTASSMPQGPSGSAVYPGESQVLPAGVDVQSVSSPTPQGQMVNGVNPHPNAQMLPYTPGQSNTVPAMSSEMGGLGVVPNSSTTNLQQSLPSQSMLSQQVPTPQVPHMQNVLSSDFSAGKQSFSQTTATQQPQSSSSSQGNPHANAQQDYFPNLAQTQTISGVSTATTTIASGQPQTTAGATDLPHSQQATVSNVPGRTEYVVQQPSGQVTSSGQASSASTGTGAGNATPNMDILQRREHYMVHQDSGTMPHDFLSIPGSKQHMLLMGEEGNLDIDRSLMQSGLTPPLLEMVHTMQYPSGGSGKEEDESGASTVAIDNKIEQAMDLVKSHLMFAVREEVEVLKEQIKELLDKNSQLEYENSVLKAAATPETLASLQQTSAPQQQPQPPTSSS